MHKEKLYLIEWQPSPSKDGQAGTTFEELPVEYLKEVGTFLKDVAAESGKLTNVYSVDRLYGEPSLGRSGEYSSSFGEEFLDAKEYPSRSAEDCPESTKAGDFLPPKGQPCISDSEAHPQLAEEVAKFVEAHSLPTGLGAIYFVLTPHDVNSCSGFEGTVAACNTNFYCAYHTAVSAKGKTIVYANMPYDDVEGCQIPDQPHGSPADDEINTLSHEENEAVSDPLGNAWFDYQGEEVGDKCTYPHFDPISDFNPEEDDYGVLLGGTQTATYETVLIEGRESLQLKAPGNAYNQEIDGGHYLLQREWSNAAGGCVAQAPLVKASFAATPAPAAPGESVSFDGGASHTAAGQLVEYEWNFGDGSAIVSGSQSTRVHIYAEAGVYTVTLKVMNDSGASAIASQQITVSSPPVATTITTTSTTTATVRTVATFARHSASEIAKLLGLPGGGAKLSGLGSISLGHAHCPVACGVHVNIVTTVRERGHVKRLQVGSLNETVAENQTGAISLKLTGTGRKLLRKAHRLRATMIVSVEDSAGGSWTIERKLSLTARR